MARSTKSAVKPDVPAEVLEGPATSPVRALDEQETPPASPAEESFVDRLAVHVDHILRNREQLYGAIASRTDLRQMTLAMLALGLSFGAIYGVSMGAFRGGWQCLVSALKVPAVLVGTMTVAAPALYAFNTLLGSRIKFDQTVALASATVATTGVLLLALAPLSLFLALTGASYTVLALVQVVIFFVAGYFGAFFLYDGMQTVSARLAQDQNLPLLQIWLCLYAYVGCQMAWAVRPFLGDPGRPLALLRPLSGNFFTALMNTVMTAVR